MKLKFAALAGWLALSGLYLPSAMAEMEPLTIQANREDSERMLEFSVKSSERFVLTQRIRGEEFRYTYNVYVYDSNWKCFSRRGLDNPEHTAWNTHFWGYDKPDEVFCMFREGFNPKAIFIARPLPVDLKLRPEQVQQIIAAAEPVGNELTQISGYLGSQPVRFDKFQYANWICLSLDPSSTLPRGASAPTASCRYRPFTLEANSENGAKRPSR